jgi:hypothetical protein
MSDERNIDRLFQESFKDFEVSPPKNAWDNIEKKLKSDSQKPIIPLWRKIAGVAALIAILFLASSQWFINSDSIDNSSPIVNDVVVPKTDDTTPTQNFDQESGPLVVFSEEDNDQESSTEDQLKTSNLASTEAPKQLASNTTSATGKFKLQPKSKKSSQTEALAAMAKLDLEEANQSLSSGGDLISDALASSAKAIENSTLMSGVNTSNNNKLSLVEVANQIAENEDKENLLKKDKTKPSWYIKPQVSPIFYGNLASGSTLDSEFAQNNGQGNVDFSYGLNVGYQLNEKLKLRTGINRVNVSYSTNDVFLLPNTQISALANVSVTEGFTSSVVTENQLDALAEGQQFGRQEAINSELRQNIGFIEFPLEVEYKLIDKKIDVNVIGGASTFLLNNNSLDVINNQGTSSIGQANNINDLSFSTNFALGFDYSLSNRLFLNLEPTFKYQFNTFQSGTTEFQPYFIGIYSGVTLKF